MNQLSTSYVLIVQDDPGIAELAIRLLARRGYRAYAVAQSAEALDVLRASPQPPCLILLDVCTPVMDGVAFRQAQQQDARLAAIPVIVCSSYSNVLRFGAQHLFDGYLTLPYEPDALLATIARYCRPVEPTPTKHVGNH